MRREEKGPLFCRLTATSPNCLKKETVYSKNSSWIMRATPIINIAALLVASLFVPMLVIPEPTDLVGNIILFLYLLALAKFFMALSGLRCRQHFWRYG